MERTYDVRAPGGRTLHVHESGDPDGRPVVTHHGTPGAGTLYAGHADLLREHGLRLIGYDRPGYGGSAAGPGRRVADAAADVAAILDAAGIGRFATWGASGGGPHALACAALLADRCAAAATIASVAPYDAPGLDWLAGMGEDNVVEFETARQGREPLAARCATYAEQLRDATPETLAEGMRSLLSDVDAAALAGGLGRWLSDGFSHGLASGADGWVDDDLAFLAPWGFALDAVAVPVRAWQGQLDLMVPAAHGRWLGDHVAGVELRVLPDDGHLSPLDRRMDEVYAWLARYTF